MGVQIAAPGDHIVLELSDAGMDRHRPAFLLSWLAERHRKQECPA
jgi:hypothetical protein